MSEEALGPQFDDYRQRRRKPVQGRLSRPLEDLDRQQPDRYSRPGDPPDYGDVTEDWGEWQVPHEYRGLAAEGMQPSIGVAPARRTPDVPRRFNPEINPPSIHAAFEDPTGATHENLAWHVDHPDPAQRMQPGGPRYTVRHVLTQRSEKPRSPGPFEVNDIYEGDDPRAAAQATVGKLSDLMRKYGPPLHLRNPPRSSEY